MQVILLERVTKLGDIGDVVDVKPGYARNYLLPQHKALRATKDNRARFETMRTEIEATNQERRSAAATTAEALDGVTCTLLRQASDSAQLYGSVSARDIAEALAEAGYAVERHKIVLDRAIKSLGIHAVRVALHPEVVVTVKVNVARTADEAEAQAAAAAGEAEAPAPETEAMAPPPPEAAPAEPAEAPAEPPAG